jgi:hypothetical protein
MIYSQKCLGFRVATLLMQFAIGCGRHIEKAFERFIKAALFSIPAIERYGLDGIIGLDKSLRCTADALTDNVGMDGGMNQLVKTGLQFFPVDDKFMTQIDNCMLFIDMVVDVASDLFDQLQVFSFHVRTGLMVGFERTID